MFESFGAGGFTVIILVVLLGMLNPFRKTLWQLVQLQTRSLHSFDYLDLLNSTNFGANSPIILTYLLYAISRVISP